MTDEQRDLFGEAPKQIAVSAKKGRSKQMYGYAGRPGAGPAGETCGSCKWKKRVRHGARSYNKCGHARGRDTRSEASDIKASAPACEFWQSKSPPPL